MSARLVREVVLDRGLLEALKPGALLIDMSSSDACETRALAPRLGARGVRNEGGQVLMVTYGQGKVRGEAGGLGAPEWLEPVTNEEYHGSAPDQAV